MGLKKTAKKKPLGPLDLDDPRDLYNQQVDAMTRPNPEFRSRANVWVFYVGTLSPAWTSQVWRPAVVSDAVAAIDRARESNVDWPTLRRIANQIQRLDERTPNDEVRMILGRAIVNRQMWVIRKNNRDAVGKADPTVFSALNGQYGTRVNFNYLAQWEGGQYLHGYVPFTKGRVAGKSGVTIATGFDIGQKSAAAIGRMNLDPDLHRRIVPFADLPLKNFKTDTSFSRSEVMSIILGIGVPVPTVTKPEADILDRVVHGEHLEAAKSAWDGARKAGVPSFVQLPGPWQTVLFSRFFHQGMSAHRTGVMRPFWTAATAGEWTVAATALANYAVSQAWYKTRVKQESTYLLTDMPPAVPKPKPKVPVPKK